MFARQWFSTGFLLFWIFSLNMIALPVFGQQALAETKSPEGSGELLWQLDFSTVEDKSPGQTLDWLAQQGIEFGIESDVIRLQIKGGRLWLSTEEADTVFFGIRLPPEKMLPARLAVLDWGVTRFATGANWEQGLNRVAIAAMFALGTQTFSSGLPFGINAAPYFLSPFIGEHETVGKLYKGRLYQEAGRYICVSRQSGKQRTRFDLEQVFQQAFAKHYGKPGIPPVSAIGFQMNTSGTQGGAEAYIESVKLFADTDTASATTE